MTLRKIAKTIVLSGNVRTGHEVINQLHQDGEPLDKAMHYIVDGMSEDERAKMRSSYEWVDEVKELVELGRNHDMYETLGQLLVKLGVRVRKLGYLVGLCGGAVDMEILRALYVSPLSITPLRTRP